LAVLFRTRFMSGKNLPLMKSIWEEYGACDGLKSGARAA
jgi:hypothetical protein